MTTAQMKTELKGPLKRHWSKWIESGVWYTARTVPKRRFGGHDYDNGGFEKGVRDCSCGCHMGGSSSGGPVDPFGPCPDNPKSRKPLSIRQIMKMNRAISGTPCVGDIRNNHVVVSVGAGFVMAVPKDRAVKFTVQEWNDMASKEAKE